MNNAGPLVLAIPVFNAERFLASTLESLNAQGPALRWWLQDGGSTDRTVEIAQRFKRPDDTIISEKDHGQADALNRAFGRMGGDIVGFLNGDDRLNAGTAEHVIRFFAEHPDIDLIYGRVEWIDESGSASGTHQGRIASLSEILDIYEIWWRDRQWVQPEVFFRRSLLERVGPLNTHLHLAFDYDFWVRCFLAGARVAQVLEVVAQFRLHDQQKSVASEKAADEIRTVVREHLPEAGIGWLRKRGIRAALEYDEYQMGRTPTPTSPRPSFILKVLQNPDWLLASSVRRRLQSSLAKVIPFRRRNSQ